MNNSKNHIFIIGMMGSGKSSIAPLLSSKMNIPYIDTDKDLVEIMDAEIKEIFTSLTKEKFYQIKEGVHLFDDTFFNLEKLIQQSTTNWTEPEWGFPKGRRNYQESDLHCALREFSEETGFPKSKLSVNKLFFLSTKFSL